LSRELKGVEFKYQLIKVKAPKNLKLIKNYYVHTRNFSKYKHFFDTLSGDWISDSLEVLDSLITLDIHSSSNMKANEIGIYFHSKTNKYYIQSTNYCALVKIHTTSKLKVRRIMKKYGYTIDKREMCLDLMNTMQYCDYVEQSNKQNLDLDINCYFLYSY
jgi:hypothetical protein